MEMTHRINGHPAWGSALSDEEQIRLRVIHAVMQGRKKREEACRELRLSPRQVRRLVQRVMREGDAGVVHKLKGRGSNRSLPVKLKEKVLKLYTKKYRQLGLSKARTKICKECKVRVNRETLRKWLIAAGIWQARRRVDLRPQYQSAFL